MLQSLKPNRIVSALRDRTSRKVQAERYVFIVTYGRSGSTILMKLINAMDGFDIKGENNGAVQHLIESVRRLEVGKDQYGGSATRSVEHPWYGLESVSMREHEQKVRDICASDFFPVTQGKTVGGFKEIRYFQIDDKAFAYHIDFLLRFPKAKIVFLTRDAAQVVKSAWWKDRDHDEVIAMIERMDRLFIEASGRHPSSTYLFDYAQITQFEEYAKLADFLGGTMVEEEHRKICARKINQSA